MKNIKVLIGVPVFQFCEPESMQTIYELKVPSGVDCTLYFQKGYTHSQTRNLITKKSLAEKFDYTFFVDGDILLPPAALTDLLKMNEPIAAGWYIKKIPGKQIPEIYRKNENGNFEILTSIPRNEKLEVQGVGFGCVLVNNNVFRAMGKDGWFEYIYQKNGFICSEDINFCLAAKKKGFITFVDTNLCVGHIGQALYVPSPDISMPPPAMPEMIKPLDNFSGNKSKNKGKKNE